MILGAVPMPLLLSSQQLNNYYCCYCYYNNKLNLRQFIIFITTMILITSTTIISRSDCATITNQNDNNYDNYGYYDARYRYDFLILPRRDRPSFRADSAKLTRFHTEIAVFTNLSESFPDSDCHNYLSNCYAKLLIDNICGNITQCHRCDVVSITPQKNRNDDDNNSKNIVITAIFIIENLTKKSSVKAAIEEALKIFRITASVNVLSLCLNCASGTVCMFSSDDYYLCVLDGVIILLSCSLFVLIVCVSVFICAYVRHCKTVKNRRKKQQQNQNQNEEPPVIISSNEQSRVQQTPPVLMANPYPYPASGDLPTIAALIPRVKGPALPRPSRIARAIPLSPLSVTALPPVNTSQNLSLFETSSSSSAFSPNDANNNRRTVINNNNNNNNSKIISSFHPALEQYTSSNFDFETFEPEDELEQSERFRRHEMVSRSVRQFGSAGISDYNDESSPASMMKRYNTIGRTNLSTWEPNPYDKMPANLPRPKRSNYYSTSNRTLTQLFKQIQQSENQ